MSSAANMANIAEIARSVTKLLAEKASSNYDAA